MKSMTLRTVFMALATALLAGACNTAGPTATPAPTAAVTTQPAAPAPEPTVTPAPTLAPTPVPSPTSPSSPTPVPSPTLSPSVERPTIQPPGSPGVATRDDGQQHIPQGVPIDRSNLPPYSSDPPTSGPHWPSVAIGSRISDAGEPDEQLVHNLEHGYVILHYNCKRSECPDTYDGLMKVYRRFQSTNKVIMNYRPKTRSRIALTAWARLDTMDAFDEARIERFVEAWLNKAPESGAP